MENAATMEILLEELGYALQGLLDAGYNEQFERVICNASSDFHVNFFEGKEYFALFVENGMLKYYAFDTITEVEKALERLKKLGDTTSYRIVPRVIAEMLGREYELYQYQEAMTDSDAKAIEYANKQQEIIDFIFSGS